MALKFAEVCLVQMSNHQTLQEMLYYTDNHLHLDVTADSSLVIIYFWFWFIIK